jgi:putative toxin-antitoxin system antitoxin component (TIGR02293 family)
MIAQELGEAARVLAKQPEAPLSVRALVEDLADQIVDMGVEPLAIVDPVFWTMLQNAALTATRALQIEDDRQQRRRLRVSIEQMRFLFARLAEGKPVAEERGSKEVVRWLADTLQVPQRRLAGVLGVGERTVQRWMSESDATTPDGEDARRLRLVARLANQLRHSFAGPGVVAWLEEPHSELGGHRPVDLLETPGQAEELMQAAIASRISIAT